jgi:hypothetical protein
MSQRIIKFFIFGLILSIFSTAVFSNDVPSCPSQIPPPLPHTFAYEDCDHYSTGGWYYIGTHQYDSQTDTVVRTGGCNKPEGANEVTILGTFECVITGDSLEYYLLESMTCWPCSTQVSDFSKITVIVGIVIVLAISFLVIRKKLS